jgi:hypothetical protein
MLLRKQLVNEFVAFIDKTILTVKQAVRYYRLEQQDLNHCINAIQTTAKRMLADGRHKGASACTSYEAVGSP